MVVPEARLQKLIQKKNLTQISSTFQTASLDRRKKL